FLQTQRIKAADQHLLVPRPQVDTAVVDRVCQTVTGRVQHEAAHGREPTYERRPVRGAVAEAMQEQRRLPGADLHGAQSQTRPRERERVDGWGQRVTAEDT